MSKSRPDPLDDPALVRAMRNVCPKEGSGITSVTFSAPGHKPVTLTAASRKRLDARLRALRQERAYREQIRDGTEEAEKPQ